MKSKIAEFIVHSDREPGDSVPLI